MITCIVCKRSISLVDVANPEAYRGEERTTCSDCASSAARALAAIDRNHRLNARDRGTHARRRYQPGAAGYRTGVPAADETWALCDRCLGYLESHNIVTYKTDGRRIRWLGTDLGHPATGSCDACGVRRARRHAVLRVAPARTNASNP